MNVLWTDEKKFELFNSKRRQHCRKKVGEALRDDTIQPTVKHRGEVSCFGSLLWEERLVTFTESKES